MSATARLGTVNLISFVRGEYLFALRACSGQDGFSAGAGRDLDTPARSAMALVTTEYFARVLWITKGLATLRAHFLLGGRPLFARMVAFIAAIDDSALNVAELLPAISASKDTFLAFARALARAVFSRMLYIVLELFATAQTGKGLHGTPKRNAPLVIRHCCPGKAEPTGRTNPYDCGCIALPGQEAL